MLWGVIKGVLSSWFLTYMELGHEIVLPICIMPTIEMGIWGWCKAWACLAYECQYRRQWSWVHMLISHMDADYRPWLWNHIHIHHMYWHVMECDRGIGRSPHHAYHANHINGDDMIYGHERTCSSLAHPASLWGDIGNDHKDHVHHLLQCHSCE